MKVCMLTTFFGAHSFGGDAAYVDRLSRALLRRGHQVDVVHSVDAFEAVRGGQLRRPYTPPPGLRVHALQQPLGRWSVLWAHQTGRPGPLLPAIRRVLDSDDFDVLHFHNISLIGGPAILSVRSRNPHAVKLMSVHEHWLLCPLSLLWKLHRQPCDRPACLRCTVAAGRPPQLWRYTGLLSRAVRHVDAFLFPSRHTLDLHRRRGLRSADLHHLPYFLPEDWAAPTGGEDQTPAYSERPYFAAAGRLVEEKGFQRLIPLLARMPEADLKIAGVGPLAAALRDMAAGLPNVQFLGWLDHAALARLYAGARATLVPSLFCETFGYVVAESCAMGAPVIVRRVGALPELIRDSGAGLVCDTDDEWLRAMRTLLYDDDRRRRLGEQGARAVRTIWSEDAHLEQYFERIAAAQGARPMTREPG